MNQQLRNRLVQKAIDDSIVAIDFMCGAEWMYEIEVVPLQEQVEALKAKLEKAVSALKYVASDYPKSYIHDSDYERCKRALKEIEGE